MKSILIFLGCIFGFCAFLALGAFMWFMGTYSALNHGNQNAKTLWGNVDAAVQRRGDLIPNLVSTVKGYAKHEEKVFTDVTEARARVGQIDISKAVSSPETMQQLSKAQGELSGALSRLLVVAENYPELKANQNFLELQSQLEGTENRINVARQRYNEGIASYNVTVNGIFSHLVANAYGFKERPYFEAEAAAKVVPSVKF